MKISIDNISYRYPRSKAYVFEDFSLDVKYGITLFKGFSGCGKSTLLRLIGSLLKPQKGHIETSSKYRFGSSAFLRSDVGVVFQQLNLLPLASVKRNIQLAYKLAGVSGEESQRWVELLGLSHLMNSKVSNLSGGQKQRAAIARALSKKSSLILLDEPTSGLDDFNTEIIKKALQNNLREGATCLIATHDHRLETIANEIVDFNSFLPLEEHLQEMG